jgi:DHA1 family bicyclomycin/chloramphenicol resistance-like MFS transporter
MALGQLVVGPLSDRWGRRRPVLAGLGTYAAASVLSAVAPTAEVLTGARLLQGVAGGSAVVIARAVVRDIVSGPAAAAYFSRLVLVFGVAPIVAPGIGVVVLGATTWRGIFLVLGAIGGLLLVAAAAWLPETRPAGQRTHGGPAAVLRGMGGLLADRRLLGYVLVFGATGAGLFGYLAGSSFVLQEVYGASTPLYAVLFALNALGLVLVGQLNGWLVRWVPPRRLLAVALAGMLAAALGLLVAARFHSLVGVAIPLAGFLAAFGAVMPNATALALDRHPERAGTASALLGAVQGVCGAVAAPLVGLGGGGSAVPMGIVMTAAAGIGVGAFALLTGGATGDARTAAPTGPAAPVAERRPPFSARAERAP